MPDENPYPHGMETPPPKPLTQKDLYDICDRCTVSGVKIPREAGAFLHSGCHPEFPFVSAKYTPDDGVLRVYCGVCNAVVLSVLVSSGNPEVEDY